MENYIHDTLTTSPYPFWITMLLFIGISALINYLIVYSKERARREVEKETAAQITKEIESVKDNYNKSLELYRFELERFFESSKSIINLCNSLDVRLIRLIIECKENMDNDLLKNNRDYTNTVNSIYKLGRFFLVYKSRYDCNKHIKEIINITSLISCIKDCNELKNEKGSTLEDKIEELENLFHSFLAEILPKFNPTQIKEPEH